jgi:hypothetical protein
MQQFVTALRGLGADPIRTGITMPTTEAEYLQTVVCVGAHPAWADVQTAMAAAAQAAAADAVRAAWKSTLDRVTHGNRSRLAATAVRGLDAEAVARNAELDDWDTEMCTARDAAIANGTAPADVQWPAAPTGLAEFLSGY